MEISLIAAASLNHVIGIGNDLPWNLPADMKFFKEKTSGHHMLMGRKTWEILGKPLPNRISIVLSSGKITLPADVYSVQTLEDGLQTAKQRGETELMVIGGGQLYKAAIPFATRIYLTEIQTVIEGGTAFFPEIDRSIWRKVQSDFRPADERNPFDMSFDVYERKSQLS